MVSPGVRRFRHVERDREALAGDTLLEALARQGLPNLTRSVRYHRPRGPFCGTGDCTGCLARVNGRPNVRACRHVVADGDLVDRGNAWPTPGLDFLGAVDFLFPSGIDTLRGFRRPTWARNVYHWVNRRLAGYGAAPAPGAAEPLRAPPRTFDVEAAVVGGGAAGAAAAARLAGRGLRPLLLDRRSDLPPVPGVEMLLRTTVTFVPPPDPGAARPFTVLAFEEPGRGVRVRCRALVVAAGSYDAQLLFGGNDRPGIVAADLALQMARPGRSSPLRRAVVVGGGSRAGEVLDRLGRTVCAVVSPTDIGPEVTRRASELGVPLYPRSLVLHAEGRSRVRSLRLRGRSRGPGFSIACDSVVLAHRRLPLGQLLFQAGAALAWRPDPGAYFPRVTAGGATTVPGLFVAGSGAGFGREESGASGERAAESLVGGAAPALPSTDPPSSEAGPLEGYYRELLREPRRGKWIACACEDILLEEIESAEKRGYSGIEVIKRYTGTGSGLCQGRYCLPDALLLLSILEGRPPPEVGYITQRPPAVPMPLAALAALSEGFPAEGAG
ncbi:MAG: 2Fe-2S iron-sulfur cluster-binding protein [Thermoplasmata archaeon]